LSRDSLPCLKKRMGEYLISQKVTIRKKTMGKVIFRPIGTTHSPSKDIKGMPIQPTGALDIAGTVEIEPSYVDGLKDIEGFSHVILIYHLHLSKRYSLKVKPFLDNRLHGVFSTRAPNRPNPIGISVVGLVKVEGRTLHIIDWIL